MNWFKQPLPSSYNRLAQLAQGQDPSAAPQPDNMAPNGLAGLAGLAGQATTQPQSPAQSILAGAKNAPLIRILPADMAGVPDPVRRAFQEPGTQGAFFHKETPEGKQERLRLEADGASGFYTPSQSEVWIRGGMTPADEKMAAYHELAGHYGLSGSLGDNYDAIMARAQENPTVARLAQAMKSKTANYDTQDDAGLAEEALSELAAAYRTGDYSRIEQGWGAPVPAAEKPGLGGMLSRVVQLTKRKLSGLTGHEPHAFNDEQVHRMLEGAWRYVKDFDRPHADKRKGIGRCWTQEP